MLHTRALRGDMLSATLDLLVIGIVLVDCESRIVHTNRAGMRCLEEARAVRRSRGRLIASDPGAALALRGAITQAARCSRRGCSAVGIATPLPDADGRALAAWVLPLTGALPHPPDAPCSAQAAVFLREIGDTPRLPGELLARHYGVTPAEYRVLMSLIRGMSPHEMADALGCSETTVRTHLRHLFAKTRTRGQSDLMRLAMSVAPAVMDSAAAADTIALPVGQPPSGERGALNRRVALESVAGDLRNR
jgi:DNA-binding CsgD family transcriptional regulator